MPDLHTELKRVTATELIQAIMAATGEKSYRAAREQVRLALIKAWPEAMGESPIGEQDEARRVVFTDKQLRAMGEGFLSLLSATNSNGSDMIVVMRLAAELKITKWMDHYLKVEDLPGLDIPLDDEPEIGEAK